MITVTAVFVKLKILINRIARYDICVKALHRKSAAWLFVPAEFAW